MEDLYVCPRCDGTQIEFFEWSKFYFQRCPLCKGKGKVDWITKAMGYKKKEKRKE